MNLVIITGTTRGLGKALADQFRAENWSVLELRRPGFDLERAGELAPAIFARAARFSAQRVVLVNNAAGLHIEPAASQSLDTIRDDLTANILGPILLMAAFIKAFPSGEIINVTSGVVETNVQGWSLYSTAKAAIERYIRALAHEGHKASNFNPGVIDTDMQAKIRESDFAGVEGFRSLNLSPASEVATRLISGLAGDAGAVLNGSHNTRTAAGRNADIGLDLS